MAQLRLSTSEGNAFVDQQPSYKEYKKKIINGYPGRALASLYAVVQSLPFIIDPKNNPKGEISETDLIDMVQTFALYTNGHQSQIVKG